MFAVSCSQNELPEETAVDISGPEVDETSLAPSNFFYSLPTAIYFKDVNISPNTPNVEGSKDNISYSISPALPIGLNLDSQTGIISGTPISLQDRKNYTISVKNDYGLVSYTLSIKVAVPPPSSLNYNLSNEVYYRNINIGSFTPSVVGNVLNYSIDPSLPEGLEFDTVTGKISGTPSQLLAKRSFSVKAHNDSGFAEFNFYLNVIDVAPSNLFYDLEDATYNVNQQILANRPNASGGAIDLFVIDPVELPPGLFFNSNNGYIEGKPLFELPSPVDYTITAFNTGGSTSTQISIRVLDKAPATPAYDLVNINYTKDEEITPNTVECSGLRYDPEHCSEGRPTNFTVSPNLPSGLFLNPNNGTIYGQPDTLSNSQAYTVTASNSGGIKTTTLTISIIDKPPYLLSYGDSDFKIRKNEYFERDIVSNEGGDVVEFQITPELPTGLFFNNLSGKISGIPSSEYEEKIHTVTGFNSGGSFSFLIKLTVLPVPNYDFEYKLVSKVRTFSEKTIDSYLFEVKNTSREYDDSKGINLSLPLSIDTSQDDLVFKDNINDSPCLNLLSFGYLETCNFKIDHIVNLDNLEEEFVFNINFSNVKTKEVDLKQFFDLSPQDVELSSERSVINKVIVDHSFNTPQEENLATLNNDLGLVSLANNSNALKEDNPLNLVNNLVDVDDNFPTYLLDPDEDTFGGYNIYNNLSFSNIFNVTADLQGYTGYCEVSPPFEVSGSCLLGDFNISSNNINYSGKFKVLIGVNEGIDQEKTESNEIDINVFQVKRISKNFSHPKRLVSHKNKVYFSALKDGETINTRKLLKYNPNNEKLEQVVAFLPLGDDRAFPVKSYGDLLVFKARNPNNATVSFYTYEESQNKVEHLYCEDCSSPGTQKTLLSMNIDDKENSFIFDDKLFLIARKSNEISSTGYLYYYDKNTNTVKKAINNFYINSGNENNGLININSIITKDKSIIFETYMVNSNDIGSYKLNYFDIENNKHRYLSNRNGFGENDNLSDPFSYDNNIFYISKGAGNPQENKPELVYLNLNNGEEELTRIFTGLVNGEGKIFGSYYGKLFFKMKGLNSDVLYYYDALTQKVFKMYETDENNLLFDIERFSNFDGINEMYFIEYDSDNDKRHLMILKQNGLDFVVERVLDGTNGLNINESTTMFTFKSHTFFSCGFNLENICLHNIEKSNLSLVAENIKIYTEPRKIKRNSLEGIIYLNNRVYIGTQNSSRGEKAGLYEICLKGLNGCL